MAGLLPKDAKTDTVLPNWVPVMAALLHIGVERSEMNSMAVAFEMTNSRNFAV
jgi:hypothetical protein